MRHRIIVKTLAATVIIGGGIAYFAYQAMQSSWSYYYSVDDFAAADKTMQTHSFRLAGRVQSGSVARDPEHATLRFTLAGARAELPVRYTGLVPDNFTEDREVVVEGRLDPAGTFRADTLMTRCESKYQAKAK